MKKMTIPLMFALLTISSLFLISCTPTSTTSTAESFVDELNYYYGGGYGDDFYLVKEHGQEAYSYAVVYDRAYGEYVAYNLDFYYPGMDMNTYLNRADSNDIIGDLYPTGSGTYYSPDFDIYFEETSSSSKDLEKIAAFMQEKNVASMGEKLSAEFGLSEQRGIQIAKLASQWRELKKKRSLTAADSNAFSTQLIGVDLDSATKAYKKSLEGDNSDLNNIFDKAALVNETTPERINKIFKEIVSK